MGRVCGLTMYMKKDLLHVSGMMVSTMEKIPGDRINR